MAPHFGLARVEVVDGVYVKHDLSINDDEVLMDDRVALYLPHNQTFKKRDMVLSRSEVAWTKKDGSQEKVHVRGYDYVPLITCQAVMSFD